MNDLEWFRSVLVKTAVDYDETTNLSEHSEWIGANAVTVITAHPGYRAQFQAAFDKDGTLIDIGDYGEI